MAHSYDYDRHYAPAMPAVEITIGQALATPQLLLRALVDTGADATMIPLQYLRQIQAELCDQAWVRAVTTHRVRVDIYAISVQISDFEQAYLEVVANTRTGEVILGRDILNHLLVTLNGLARTVEVSS